MTRISTPFGASSTAEQVLDGVDLTDRHAIVTGATSGLGTETARALASAGAEVILAVRNLGAGAQVAAKIGANVDVRRLDTADQSSVEEFAKGWSGPLDILVNNAGIMAVPEQCTAEGWELHFATNYLGHFALANALHGSLAAAGEARIVSVSSALHLASPIVFDDIHYRFRRYHPFGAYAQSKTADVLFAVAASRRWAGDGITANSLMPGYIQTNLQQHTNAEALVGMTRFATVPPKTVEQGAATSILLAASPLVKGVGGATSRTATRPRWCTTATAGWSASPRGRWARGTPRGCGRSPRRCLLAPAAG
ncbi:LOW QUALITY PROTEIN: short-chain dehydrogenase/reductase family oxidoreductase, partial [Kutzneria sp. 744]